MIELNEALNLIKDHKLVLVGIGEEFDIERSEYETQIILGAYKKLFSILKDKNYYIITTNNDNLIDEAFGSDERILKTFIFDENDQVKNWDKYSRWLSFTLNNELLILELGVGLRFPDAIRFPNEKIAFYNMKSKLLRIHHMLYQIPEEISEKGIGYKCNAIDFLNKI